MAGGFPCAVETGVEEERTKRMPGEDHDNLAGLWGYSVDAD